MQVAKKIEVEEIIVSRKELLRPLKSTDWASEMVLNPAVIRDPKTNRLHLLFRATGPWPEKQLSGQPLPFPIFLGYMWSDDEGLTWQVDSSGPALAPALESEVTRIKIKNVHGQDCVNYANGCIEDPRMFFFEEDCFMTVACRMFAPGPYWEKDEPTQCCPAWHNTEKNVYGRAAAENVTVNVLYKVDLAHLATRNYDQAFQYICHLTCPEKGENRDVIIFPEKIEIEGKAQIVALHRPWVPSAYEELSQVKKPSIIISYAEKFEDFATEKAKHRLLAEPIFDWEGDRIGASGPVVKLNDTEWLLSYHGKKNSEVGYTQSFMILSNDEKAGLSVKNRCPLRLIVAQEDWEMPGRFKTPVIFITGMIKLNEEKLLITYGAADERVGMAVLNTNKLEMLVRSFDAHGNNK